MSVMKSRRVWLLSGVVAAGLALGGGWVGAQRLFPLGLKVVPVVTGLEIPWAMAFLPDGRILVTERPGYMRIAAADGTPGPRLKGVPEVYHHGEGGLMDVLPDTDFASNKRIFFTYSEPPAGAGASPATVVASATLSDDSLQNVQILLRQDNNGDNESHFGSRLLIDKDGYLFVGLGDRGVREQSQSLSTTVGKILRLNRDGSIPADNPFHNVEGANPAIWSYGHRNVQGMMLHPVTGELWATEHGPNGGDEINIVRRGANYGWPVITYGCEYVTCAKIGEGTEKAGMEQPVTWFGPNSIPLTAMQYIDSPKYPALQGQMLVGTLWGQTLMQVKLDGSKVIDKQPVRIPGYGRVRDLAFGPDGYLYMVVNGPEGQVVRLDPFL